MRTLLITLSLALISSGFASGQVRYAKGDFVSFQRWFLSQSKPSDVFRQDAVLFAFRDRTALHTEAERSSPVITELPAGWRVQSLSPAAHDMVQDQINGYGDYWFRVRLRDAIGRQLEGYIWGGDLARAWQWAGFFPDGNEQLIMLGMSDKPFLDDGNIEAELRIAEKGRILYRKSVPSLCVFGECASKTLLRVFDNKPEQGGTMVEASTMVAGCTGGVEKAFYYWNGRQLERVYHAEYTTGTELANNSFYPQGSQEAISCYYGGEDKSYNPVWICKTQPRPQPAGPASRPVVRAAPRAR